jgi:hypothetical protein
MPPWVIRIISVRSLRGLPFPNIGERRGCRGARLGSEQRERANRGEEITSADRSAAWRQGLRVRRLTGRMLCGI